MARTKTVVRIGTVQNNMVTVMLDEPSYAGKTAAIKELKASALPGTVALVRVMDVLDVTVEQATVVTVK